IVAVLHAHQDQGAQHLRRREATPALVRLSEAAHQVAARPLDQRRLLIKKITDRPQQRLKPHALPQQFAIGKTHLPRRRPGHGSTQPAENRWPQLNRSAAHAAADDIGRPVSVATNHLSNETLRASHKQAKLAAEKRWKRRFCRTALPFATETS